MDAIARHVEPKLRRALGGFRVVQVVGARQVGKTTLARLVSEPERVFVSLDEPADRERAAADPSGFLASFGDQPLLIDEVQRVPDLYLSMKRVVDEDPRPGRFLLTGSAEPRTSRRIRDSLAGRIGLVELRCLSQGELAGRRETFLERVAVDPDPTGPGWRSSSERGLIAHVDRMLAGGFPATAQMDDDLRRDWLAQYADAVFTSDVRELARIDDVSRLERLFRLVASHSGQLLKPTSIARDAALSSNTAHAWVALLAETRTIDIVAAWSGNQRARLVETPRGYVSDSGLLAATLRLRRETILRDAIQSGCLVETFVVQELHRQRTWLGSSDAPTLLHYRDRDQHEVDVVVERPDGGIVGIEVKAAATVRSSDASGLRALARRTGDRFVGGLVVYCGEHPAPLGDRITAVPITNLWSD